VPRSRDLVAALTLLTVTIALSWQPELWIGRWRDLFGRLLTAGSAPELGSGVSIFLWTAITLGEWVAPILTLAFCMAVFSHVAQGGFVFSTERFKPNFARLNPASNVKALFSLSGLSRSLRSVVPAAGIVFVVVSLVQRDLLTILHISRFGPRAILARLGALIFEMAWKCGLVMLVWSAADYFLQRWSFERSLMMTKEEVRQEMKDTQGNPTIRGRIKRLRRTLYRKMLAKEVARATAVVTNPTHFAVALEYRPETMPAPVVVAKGRNLIAEKIKQIARWHEIPIIENPPLAQALYKGTEVGQSIPPNLYVAVAEILAFLYRTKARLQALQQQPRAEA